MSRHRHRLSFVYSLPLKPWLCGVCRKEIDRDYGAFACNACSGYAVHTNCALRRDLWDGIDLEGVPEEEYEDVSAFKWIEDGFIMDHFSHDHHLKLEDSKVFDENKICQACGLPIYDGSFFSCGECNFILHEACAKAPRKTFTPSHPHQIQLEVMEDLIFSCNACGRHGNGFIYKCSNADCDVDEDFDSYLLDMRCAMVSEPFTYQGHPHPLYLSLDPEEETTCGVCKSTTNGRKAINCIVCEFTICFNCATLPYMVKYKHDEHFLTFSRGHETSESDWCEICEGKLAIIGKEKGFYKCEDCCTTLHIHCLLRIDPYLVAGKSVAVIKDSDIRTQRNISFSRKFCSQCAKRCPYPTLIASEEDVFCSIACRREYNEEMSWFRIV